MVIKGRNTAVNSRQNSHANINLRTYSQLVTAPSGGYNQARSNYVGGARVYGQNAAAGGHQTVKGGFEGPMVAPWRKTVSIFKQPVTLVRTTSRETKPAPTNEIQAASRAGTGRIEKPKQVFWAKRLEGLRAMMPVSARYFRQIKEKDAENAEENEDLKIVDENPSQEEQEREISVIDGEPTSVPEAFSLPSRILPVGPDVTEDVAAASLTSALQAPPLSGTGGQHPHLPPITGQTNPKKHLDTNPGVFTNPDQPLIHAVVVSDQDITSQEHRVLDARRRLEEAMKHFG